jgi:hypothetical protein
MLTRTSSSASRSKMLVLLPLLAIAASCFTQNSTVFAQEYKKEGNVVTYNGNKITLTEDRRDTITVLDPVTGKELTQVRIMSPRPDKLNGNKIHDQDFVTAMPTRRNKMFSLEEQLATNLALKFNSFPDGIYRVDVANFVIDEKGKVVYFEFGDLKGKDENGRDKVISNEQIELIKKEIAGNCKLVEMKPATLDGKNVPVLSDLSMQEYKFSVKDHITSYNKTYN